MTGRKNVAMSDLTRIDVKYDVGDPGSLDLDYALESSPAFLHLLVHF